MKQNIYRLCRNLIFYIPMLLLAVFSVYLLVIGSFSWPGGSCLVYQRMNPIFRGSCLIAVTALLLCAFGRLSAWLDRQSLQALKMIALIGGAVFFVLQMSFVMLARAGIRYDALKVVDEAVALFSQNGMKETDLNGYFARYANNHAMTIMTHCFIKAFRAVGLIRRDFSNAVLVLQFINVFFVDAAFAGCYSFLNKYSGRARAVCFLLYMACNPLSYIWLPFYYTNTCSMAFSVWGIWFLFSAFDLIKQEKTKDEAKGKTGIVRTLKGAAFMAVSGILFYIGYKIRATVIIALIAGLLGQVYRSLESMGNPDVQGGKKTAGAQVLLTCGLILVLIFSMGATRAAYRPIEDHYLDFDTTDTVFPFTHWIAMGLSYYGDGSYNAEDEQNTMNCKTAQEKKETTTALIRQRMHDLGAKGVFRLYMKKLSNTFGDGAGGYHSELNISRDYGFLWKIVYGTNRDPILIFTQVMYLLSVLCTIFAILLLQRKKLPDEFFVFFLLLIGSYLFQMIWESATIYSIGTMYVNGILVSAGLAYPRVPYGSGDTQSEKRNQDRWFITATALGFAGVVCIIAAMAGTEYVKVSMSVNQFLFQAEEYPALSEGQQIRQTFRTEKKFSTIVFQVRNYEGSFNDGIYLVSLYDGEGNLLQQQELIANTVPDYGFCQLSFHNEDSITDYEICIEKESGTEELIFLYYDTGHYDTYPDGKMTGPVEGDMADLLFEVYDREEK